MILLISNMHCTFLIKIRSDFCSTFLNNSKLPDAQQKKLSSLAKNCSLPTFRSNTNITNLTQCTGKNPIYLKLVYVSLSNQIKFKNPKDSTFIDHES